MKNEYFEKSYNEKDCTICRLRANGLIFRREFSDGVSLLEELYFFQKMLKKNQ